MTQFLSDVLVTAIEGGVQYWSNVLTYDGKSRAVIVPFDEDAESEVTTDTIRLAFQRLRAGDVKGLHPASRRRYLREYRSFDYDFDAADASAIVQIGLFSEVVFG
jgi:hypothetical protein